MAGATEKRGKILLLSYYWPPSAGAGVQRWLKMTKYLVEMGWEVTVYTPSNPEVAHRDEALLADVPEGVEVLQRRAFEPLALVACLRGRRRGAGESMLRNRGRRGLIARFMVWVRANFFIPDARALWVAPSVRYLLGWLSEHPVDAVISTGPPHSMHLIARALHQRRAVLWVADFRDPWVNIDYMHHLPLTRRARRKHERLERAVVREASAVVVVTEGMRAEYAALRGSEVHLIPNGYDPADFVGVAPKPSDGVFRLLHLGSLNDDRNPSLLWEAIAALRDGGRIRPDELQVHLVGVVGEGVKASVQAYGVGEYVQLQGYVAHREVPRLLTSATALLLVINSSANSKGILTGKLFEYLASRRPIVCLGPTDGDAAVLLRDTQAGVTFSDGSSAQLASYILESIRLAKEGQYACHSLGIERYSRRQQAKDIADIVQTFL